ncbi:hypothetical protein SASPL_123510 [Salvia splendens]|uniref:Reverse transcriptase Ty1/copia-type domain-containing protein n=1 Tax=Salvia splendens TaxID=180675 RepID=A0A8X8XRB3_SALSN|nr:hypothetical protein SASPL_123510 [Salvia splendens]
MLKLLHLLYSPLLLPQSHLKFSLHIPLNLLLHADDMLMSILLLLSHLHQLNSLMVIFLLLKILLLHQLNVLLQSFLLLMLPPGKNLIGNTWVLRLKKHVDGSIARHKARLVAQGFSQEPGFDFGETFSPLVKPTTISDLEEDIYMRPPIGFEQGDPSLVCKLNKALGSVNMVIQTEVAKEKSAKGSCDATYPMPKIISSCATLEPMLAVPTWKEVLLGGIG